MPQINNITQKQINAHVGEGPVFDPSKEERPQVIKWIQWSAKRDFLQALMNDAQKRAEGFDPDEGRE